MVPEALDAPHYYEALKGELASGVDEEPGAAPAAEAEEEEEDGEV